MAERATALRQRLAASLRDLRDRSGCTLRELERITFTSDSALSRYLTAKAVPPWRVLEGICEVAGADPEQYRTLWTQARAASRGPHNRATSRQPEPLDVAQQLHATLADAITVIVARADVAADEIRGHGDGTALQALRDIQSTSRHAMLHLLAAEPVLCPDHGDQ